MRFIAKRLIVVADELMGFAPNRPHICMAISLRANKPITGGKGILVCTK